MPWEGFLCNNKNKAVWEGFYDDAAAVTSNIDRHHEDYSRNNNAF